MRNEQKVYLSIVGVIFLAGAVIGFCFVGIPKNHILSSRPNDKSIPIVDFEAGYFTYLATVTGAVLAGLLALLEFSKAPGNWRIWAGRAFFCFLTAIVLVTIGYALRNLWRVGQKGLWSPLLTIDVCINDPSTSLFYAVGVCCLVRSLLSLVAESQRPPTQ